MSNFTVAGSGARKPKWVGPTIQAPASGNSSMDRVRSTSSGRQRHYGAVELAGSGEKVALDDVVVVNDATSSSRIQSEKTSLAQIQSLWEDTFTGVFKFRARWLMHADDLPGEAMARLVESRRADASRRKRRASGDTKPTGRKPSDEGYDPNREAGSDGDIEGKHEVFLTPRTEELDVKAITERAVLSVTVSDRDEEAGFKAESQPRGSGDSRPRLTHTYSPASGEFSEISGTDPIIARARIRLEDAAAVAAVNKADCDKDKKAPALGKNNGKRKGEGWLRQKEVPNLATRGRGRGRGRQFGGGAGRSNGGIGQGHSGKTQGSSQRSSSPSNNEDDEGDTSEDSDTVVEPDPTDEPWEEEEDGVSDTDTEGEFATGSTRGGKSRAIRSAKSRSASGAAPAVADGVDDYSSDVPSKALRCRTSSSLAIASDKDDKSKSVELKPSASDSNAHQPPQRRPRAPASRRQGPLPTRPRRLSIPPGPALPVVAGEGAFASPASTTEVSIPTISRTRPMRTRLNTGAKGKSSTADGDGVSNGKRKRVGTGKAISSGQSDFPPRHSLVGKEYQAEIPDLLPQEQREKRGKGEAPPAGTGTRMVWRSASHWDARSKSMLAEYMRAAKAIVQVKQARAGVAVHIRLGGTPGDIGEEQGSDEKKTRDATGGSYAVWAITTGRESGEVQEVRVGCSENEQTEVPRSAIQRVSCEEEALTGLMRARCMLDNFKPALEMFAKDDKSPQSIQPWTFAQVRMLERALEKEFDPNRHPHTWARPGVDMDREDYIDLAKVSKQVLGKNPQEVLAFYYKYLAAAEPLTDVVFGPEAATNRRNEPIGPLPGAVVPPLYSHQTRNSMRSRPDGNARTSPSTEAPEAQDRGQSSQAQHGSQSSLVNGASLRQDYDDSDATLAKQLRIRLTAPRAIAMGGDPVAYTHNEEPHSKFSVRSRGNYRGDSPHRGPPGPVVGTSSGDNAVTGGPFRKPLRAGYGPGAVRSGYPFGGRSGPSDRAYHPRTQRSHEEWGPNVGGPRYEGGRWREDGEDEVGDAGLQHRRASRDVVPPRISPPDTEVLEVLDDDSGDELNRPVAAGDSAAMRRHPNAAPRSGGTAAAGRWGLVAEGEGAWNSRQRLHRQQPEESSSVATALRQPSGILPIPSRTAPNAAVPGGHGHGYANHPGGNSTTRPGGEGHPHHPSYRSTYPATQRQHYGYRREPPPAGGSFPVDDRAAAGRWERGPPGPPSSSTYSRGSPAVDGASYRGPIRRGPSAPTGGGSGHGNWAPRDGGRGGGYLGSDSRASVASSADAQFGAMAPCWRLLERAKDYMEENQLAYMKGLILTHVKKPMTRRQLLERAQSCLHEQDKIFDAFVKMFDCIEEPLTVPFYPSSISKPSTVHPRSSLAPNGMPHHEQPHAYKGSRNSSGYQRSPHQHTRSPDLPRTLGYPENAVGGKSAALQVPLPPQLAVEVSGLSSRHSNPNEPTGAVGGGSGRGGHERVKSSTRAPPGRPSAYIQPHPRSTVPLASGAGTTTGRWAGSSGSSTLPGPHRSPPTSHRNTHGPGPASFSPRKDLVGPSGGGPGMAVAAVGDLPPSTGGSRRDMGYTAGPPPPLRSGWSSAGGDDESATSSAAAAAAAVDNSPRQRPVTTYPGMRFSAAHSPPHGGSHGGLHGSQAQWRTDETDMSSATAAATAEAVAGNRGNVSRRSPQFSGHAGSAEHPGGGWGR